MVNGYTSGEVTLSFTFCFSSEFRSNRSKFFHLRVDPNLSFIVQEGQQVVIQVAPVCESAEYNGGVLIHPKHCVDSKYSHQPVHHHKQIIIFT